MTSSTRTRRTSASGKKGSGTPVSASPSKLDQVITMLGRPEGASLAELVALTGWQAHSVRGALAGSLKRKGHDVRSEKVEGERRYRIGDPR